MVLKDLFENEDNNIEDNIEHYDYEPESEEDYDQIIAFPSKYSQYEDEFVIISFEDEFVVFDKEQNSYVIGQTDDENEIELYNKIVDFFNDSENKLIFDEFIEQFHLDENEIEWFADFVIVDASDTLKDLLQQIK